ncbi:RRQRL motif-containing zinc-binding protein [Nocardia sp. NPDC023852]|uniref:RRQRL motif-containing zinc-binding protein n=1 Tax=Nocardia sp. NPDC023852 TaxID=3154697 RepID=UPI003406A25E
MTQGDSTTESTEGGDIQEYPWMLAPAHLQTRRQLRAAGLGPNRQGIAAVMVGKRRGRRLVAHLFDVRKAAPKRVPTPAQLQAITKATQEHQIKAAARRGISRAELSAVGDPGQAWAPEPDTTMQGGNPMPDNTFSGESAELTAIRDEVAPLRESGRIDAGLADYVNAVSAGTTDEPPQLGAPAGHGQKMAYLLASVALRQADQQATDLNAAAARGDQDAQADIDSTRAAAQRRLTGFNWASSRESHMEVLADAIVWSQDPELAELAATRLDELTADYRQSWGVVIDVDERSVGIDPDFDAQTWQRFTDAGIVFARQSAAVDVLSARPLPGRVLEAVMAWHGEPPTPETAGMYVATEKTRRAQLSAALADAGASNSVRAGVEFVVDYLRGDTSHTDLTNTPILVDPALEVRGRVAELLERFAERGDTFGAIISREVDVMTPDDQRRVREIGFDIRDGRDTDWDPWPDWIDRDELTAHIRDFAHDAHVVTAYANTVAAGSGLDDNIQDLLADMGRDRAVIQTMLTRQGLHPAEKAALTAVVEDIDNGRVDDRNLPELLLLDERSKRRVDLARHAHTAHEISARTADSVKEILGPGVDMSLRSNPGSALDAVRNDIDALASGGLTPAQLTESRRNFDENMNLLGRALRGGGVDTPTRMKIRAAVDQGVHAAGKHGKTRGGREQRWRDRLYSATPDTRPLPSTSRPPVDREQATALRLTALAQAHPCGTTTPAQAPNPRRTPAGAGVELGRKREKEGRS